MSFRLSFAALVLCALPCVSCGGGAGSSTPTGSITSGNWTVTAASATNTGVILPLAGILTQNRAAVSGTMNLQNASVDCLNSPLTINLSGNFSGDNLTLTSAPINGEVITLKVTGTGGALSGTYTITGGSSGCDDKGSATAALIPPITGNWSGTVIPSDGGTLTTNVTASITQGAFNGSYAPLSGTITLTVGCSGTPACTVEFQETLPLLTSGTLISKVAGNSVVLAAQGFGFSGTISSQGTLTTIPGVVQTTGNSILPSEGTLSLAPQ